jgi:hypothetical protein
VVIHPGVQQQIVADSPAQAGSQSQDFVIQSDAVLVSLRATAVSGTLDVSVIALVNGGESPLFSFPTLTSATTDVLLRRSSISPENIRIKVTYSDACSFEIYARAVSSGSSDVRILGAADFTTRQVTVGTSAVLLLPVSLVDRSGLVLKNWSITQTVYIGESQSAANLSSGYPLAPKDGLALDVTAGAEVWAISDAAGADMRIAEAGG